MSTIGKEESYKQFFGGKTPDDFVYEDDQCVVFDETINPQAPVHFLVVPKKVIPRLTEVTEDEEKILDHLLLVAKNVATQKGLTTGYHVMLDERRNATKMNIKSLHVFGRALHHMLWPSGPGFKL